MRHEFDEVSELLQHLSDGGDLRCAVIQGLDLHDLDDASLHTVDGESVFLGCQLSDAQRQIIQARGGLVFSQPQGVPYAVHPRTLYSVDMLTAGYERGAPESISDSYDGRVYAHYCQHTKGMRKTPVVESLAQRLHDHGIDDAMADFLDNDGAPRRVVAVMGGHSMSRTDESYRRVARIAHRLAQPALGYTLATGGGPGAMEAANLGAYLSGYPVEAIDDAIALMRPAPSYKDPLWWETALRVRDAYSTSAGESLGIPTWYYGHEPPNLFASHIAKYFSNSLREDGLLTIARHGVIYSPGSAGTIQEIFMDACQNHYVSLGEVSPMVFLDKQYWTVVKPVYPLLTQLAANRHYGEHLAVTDTEEEVVAFIRAHPPFTPKSG